MGIRISIRTKIILPYLLLAVVVVLGAVYIASQVIFDSIEERFINQLVEAGKLSSKWMVLEEDRLLETLRRMTFGVGGAEVVEAGDPDALRELVYPITVNDGVDAVEILDSEGYSILSLRQTPGGEIEAFDFVSGAETFRQVDFVRATLEQEADSLGDKFAGLVTTDGLTFLFIAGPIFNGQGALVGAVLIGMRMDSLVKGMREATLAQVTLYDLEGMQLASTFLEDENMGDAMAMEVLSRQSEESFMRPLTVAGIPYRQVLGAWNVRGDMDFGVLGVSFAENFLVRLSQQTWIQLLIWAAIVLFLVVVIGLFISQRFSRPILDLQEAAVQVSRGDFSVSVEPVGHDEVASLTEEFNKMVGRLKSSRTDLVTAYDRTLVGWAKALELRDGETEGHSQRVTIMTVRLAQMMGVDKKHIVHIQRGALLHDIGKMAIPDSILLKPGKLTEEEWEIMRQHPVFAVEMLKNIPFLESALDIPKYHHEKWDGTGYPAGLKGEQIPLPARIFSIVDYCDAILSDRPYRPPMRFEKAMEIIRRETGKHFDPVVAEKFFKLIHELQQEGSYPDDGQT